MYTEKKYTELTREELITYQLCYVVEGDKVRDEDNEVTHDTYRLYFTSIPLYYQWGDDWDDPLYNAEPPYDHHYFNDVRKEHDIIIMEIKVKAENYLELPDRVTYYTYSAADINSRAAAWLYLPHDGKRCNGASALAGMSPQEVWRAIGHVIE